MENETQEKVIDKSLSNTYYLIGAAMLFGGIGKLIMDILNEENIWAIIIPCITTAGGLCFIIVANRIRKGLQ